MHFSIFFKGCPSATPQAFQFFRLEFGQGASSPCRLCHRQRSFRGNGTVILDGSQYGSAFRKCPRRAVDSLDAHVKDRVRDANV